MIDYTREHEYEAASYSYLMSLGVVLVGLPFPLINLVATFFFYFANRKKPYFVRWHCTQALISQIPLFVTNCILFWWTVNILLGTIPFSSLYFAYLFTVILFNVLEYIVTISSAIKVRRGEKVTWYLFGDLTDLVCKPENNEELIGTIK